MWWCTCRGPWRVHLLTFSSLLARVKGTKTTTLCSTETWNILLRKCFTTRLPSTFLSNSSNQQSKNQLSVSNSFSFNYSLSGRNVRFYLYRKHSISTLTQAFNCRPVTSCTVLYRCLPEHTLTKTIFSIPNVVNRFTCRLTKVSLHCFDISRMYGNCENVF